MNRGVIIRSDSGRASCLRDEQIQFSAYTVLPAKSDGDVIFCLQSYQGLKIDRSLVY